MQERVGIIGNNSEEYVKNIISCWKMGVVPALIDVKVPNQKIKNILAESNIHRCYIEKGLELPYIYEKDLNIQLFEGCKALDFAISNKIKELYNGLSCEGEGIILYSSGTTGDNKGIVLSHKALNGNAEAIIDYMGITDKDNIYIVKPIHHSSSFTGELLVGLKANASIIVATTVLSGRRLLNALEQYKISILCVNPTILRMIVETYKENTDCVHIYLRKIYVSGSVLSKDLIMEARKLFNGCNVFNVYGLTEAGPRVTAQNEKCMNENSCGIPIKGVDVKIYDNDACEKKVYEKGNVYVKTPYKADGYINNEKIIPIEEWINTKDIGYKDENNELYIIGRADNMITSSSHNIFPEKIESIAKSHPLVRDCVVYGENDHLLGKRLVCCIEPQKESFDENTLYRELRNIFKQELTSYEIPSKYVLTDCLPKTSSGKIIRKNFCDKY